MNKDGEQIEYTEEDNQEVNVTAYMEAGVEYVLVVTTDDDSGHTDKPGADNSGLLRRRGVQQEQ